MTDHTPNINSATLKELKGGSSEAFKTIFDAYGKKIHRFSLAYLKSEQEAEEIVQEVFLKIWKVRGDLQPDRSFDSFIFTMAKNAILNTIRKSKNEQLYVSYAKLHPGRDILLDDELDFAELERAYKKAIEELSPQRKKIFLLSREKILTNAEISNQLGISIKTVENQMTTSISQIRKSLMSMGFSGLIFFDLFH